MDWVNDIKMFSVGHSVSVEERHSVYNASELWIYHINKHISGVWVYEQGYKEMEQFIVFLAT